jgi:hypothetical protein
MRKNRLFTSIGIAAGLSLFTATGIVGAQEKAASDANDAAPAKEAPAEEAPAEVAPAEKAPAEEAPAEAEAKPADEPKKEVAGAEEKEPADEKIDEATFLAGGEAGLEEKKRKEEEEASEEEKEHPRDHAKQGFVSLMGGIGWFMVAPYDKDVPEKMCKKAENNTDTNPEGEAVCMGRSGWHMDMLGGYGVIPGLDIFAIFRLGFETPSAEGMTNQPLVRQVGVGLKVHSPAEGLFKIGFGVAPLFDFSDHGGADIGYDFIIHVPIQVHFDIVQWFGAFLQVSPNISFVSEFRLEFTGGIGIEGRFP